MKKLRVIGLGNSIVTDDAVGLHVAQAVREHLLGGAPDGTEVDVVEAEVGGLGLLDLCSGFDGVVIVDALETDNHQPGEVVVLEAPGGGTSLRLCSPHEIDLSTALEIGDQLGYEMPSRVEIVAIQGQDLRTFGEGLTPRVAEAVPRAVEEVLRLLSEISAAPALVVRDTGE